MPQDMRAGRIVPDRIARVAQRHVDRLRRHILREGDIVFSRWGDVSRFAVVTDKEQGWLCGTGSIRIRLNSPDISVGYVRRYLQQDVVGKWLEHHAKGVTMPNLNTEVIRALPFVYPPLSEQRRITAVLDKADELRAKRRAALEQVNGFRQAIFLEMFGDPTTNPKGWTVCRLGDVANEIRYGTSNKSQQHGTPALRIPNIVDGTIAFKDLKRVPVDDAEFGRLRLLDGDLLFVRTNGNPDFVGRCAIFNSQRAADSGFPGDQFVFASYLIRLRLAAGTISPVFLREFMMSSQGRRELRYRSKASAGRFNINPEALASIEFPLPPIVLQQQFGQRVGAVEQLTEAQQASISHFDNLFASLQHQVFSGAL